MLPPLEQEPFSTFNTEAVVADAAVVVTVIEHSEYGTVLHNKDKFKMRGFSTDYNTI